MLSSKQISLQTLFLYQLEAKRTSIDITEKKHADRSHSVLLLLRIRKRSTLLMKQCLLNEATVFLKCSPINLRK